MMADVEFVDIHSHVVYGLDDGAKTIEDSRAMLALAARDGTTDLVATPHANSRYRFDEALLDARLAELRTGSPLRLHRGADFRLQSDTIDDALKHPRKYAINQLSYLLVEFSDLSVFPNADEVLLPLIDVGLIPIVTHPERHGTLRRRPDDLARWIALGCYVQVTAGSIAGRFGRDAMASAGDLIRRGLVQFVASDGHDVRRRPPSLAKAYERLVETWGEEAVRPMFVDNPRAVLTGDPLDAPVRPLVPRKRAWYRFWT